MIKEINIISVGDIRHRYNADIIQTWNFDFTDEILRIDFTDGSFVEYFKRNVICIEVIR